MKAKDEKILFDIYQDLYMNATPIADFNELVKNSTINEFGEKEIPFMNYEISSEKEEEIFKKHLVGKGISKFKQQQFRTTVMLGCSPKTKIND